MKYTCKICGEEFERVKMEWKCPNCKGHKARHKPPKSEETLEEKIQRHTDAADRSMHGITEILQQANAAGLSYGQYVAQEEERKTMKETLKEELGQTAQHKPGIVRRLITQALQSLDKSEVDCKEIGEARGLLTAAKMILEGDA